jgi:hypothetical protein
MNNPTIELSRSQIVAALSQFPPDALKKLIDDLFKKQLYTPRPLEEVAREAQAAVKKAKLPAAVAEEAVKWARSQK